MSILERYEAALADNHIEDNPSQRAVIEHLQRLADEMNQSKPAALLSKIRGKKTKGIYLYGPVGVGKTYLMDLFYQSLPFQSKTRLHFHHFMQQVDEQLRRLQGVKNPLQKIAADWSKSTRLICFDEFLVHDVTHAMILADLLKALLAKGVVLVITSNTQPDDLYLNGVQRDRFLPAIALIKQHCEIVNLDDKRDYRLGRTPLFEAYLYPFGPETYKKLDQQFGLLQPDAEEQGVLTIQNRSIPYMKCGGRTVWFDFQVICNLPRSQLDYLEIAERFDTVFVSHIPALTEKDTVNVILLIRFIDVMYDSGIRLLMSAAVSIDELYTKGEMSKAFKRTRSRLQEMQSEDYLARIAGR